MGRPLGALLRVDNVLRPGTYEGFKQIMGVINDREATAIIDVTPRWHGVLADDADYVGFIRQQLDNGHVLALHGVEHRCRILPEEEHKVSWLPSEDEFDCKDYHRIHGAYIPVETQRSWLREGNALLEDLFGQKTDLLMPPAHAYNTNTLAAMRAEGFVAVSDYGRWDAGPYPKEGVVVLPFDFEDYMKNTREDGSNKDAMMEMFRRYYHASTAQKGYYATFTHCDFSGDGVASPARLQMLDDMLAYVHADGNSFVDPHTVIARDA